MIGKLDGVEERFQELETLLSDPAIIKDQERYIKYSKEHADLAKIVSVYRKYEKIRKDLAECQDLLKDPDPEIKEMAKEEKDLLDASLKKQEHRLMLLLLPKDPNDSKNIFLEIRAGTGGDEAGLFAADLFKMYNAYAEGLGWKVEIMNQNITGVGGLKEVIALISGKEVYSHLKYESGVHRVQRVPTTESQGRVHTSAITVAVLPEAEELDIRIDPNEIKLDVYRSSGPGGQSVNTTDSAVRITHIPTGLVVTCQDEKSQHKNRAKALKVLRARLLDKMQQEQEDEISKNRKSQVGTGDRSERIRTYNFPQGRVTDHRIGLTLYKLENILQGDLTEIVNSLGTYYQTKALRDSETGTVHEG
ncbi:MAG: peptide chain release factor 1 [Deltaproteobacteria bacterium]|jgi:peptide chain release factor 1|nr:peptide chain release factor 1 [Deltaproteobacteria bacterium]